MNQKILCSWLGLTDESWPPEPHALLGVDPTQTSIAQVEQCVHDRLAKLRCYQCSHPEEATEGMNRLAQAFIQVTEALSRGKAKKAAVTVAVAQLPTGKPTSWPSTKKRINDDTAVGLKTEIDWRNAPPPVRGPEGENAAANGATTSPANGAPDPAENGAAKTENAPEDFSIRSLQAGCPADALDDVPLPTSDELPAVPAFLSEALAEHLAQHSAEARRGLRTLPSFLKRARQTRQLMVAWKWAGKYLGNPERRIVKPAQQKDLAQRMDRVFELMEDFPAFLGHPGKPGYRVVAIARLETTEQMFKVLDHRQRAELALDWDAGRKVLWQHHRFLLKQIKRLKRRTFLEKTAGAAESFIRAHKRWFILGLVAFVSLLVYVLIKL